MELADQQDHAAEVEQAEKVLGLEVPTSSKTAPALEPGEEPLDLPAAFVAAERAAILLAAAGVLAAALGCDELDAALFCEAELKRCTVPRLVANQSRRQVVHESSVESSLGEHTVESGSICNSDSEWKTMAVCNRHDLCRLAGAAAADAGPPFFAGT